MLKVKTYSQSVQFTSMIENSSLFPLDSIAISMKKAEDFWIQRCFDDILKAWIPQDVVCSKCADNIEKSCDYCDNSRISPVPWSDLC